MTDVPAGGAPLRVVVFPPALDDPEWEPFTYLFSHALAGAGVVVRDYTRDRDALLDADVFHVHFPEYLLFTKGPDLRRALKEIAKILRAKRRGTKVVWTVHNLSSREDMNSGRDRSAMVRVLLTRVFPALVDGFAVLSDNAIPLAEREYPRLKRKPRVVTRQGPFDGIYPSALTKDAARRILGLGADDVVGLAFGQARPYKAIPAMLDVFRAVDRPDARFVVVGRPYPVEHGEEIAARARLDPRVVTRFDYVDTADVQVYFSAADLVVLNHTQLLNSGAAMLALRFERPLLAPALGSLPELAARAWPWVTLFDDLDPQVLDAALQDATRPRAPLNLDGQTWDAHAQALVGFYRSLC